MWAANFVNSFGGNWSIAFSISARLIKPISFRRTHSQACEYPGRLRSGPPSNLDSDARSDGSERQYAPAETDPRKFVVEGEQHYWVRVAIDRFTGQVLDKQIEVMNE
jgi:hypothetical protein